MHQNRAALNGEKKTATGFGGCGAGGGVKGQGLLL